MSDATPKRKAEEQSGWANKRRKEVSVCSFLFGRACGVLFVLFQVKCWKCKGVGHVAKDCPKAKA